MDNQSIKHYYTMTEEERTALKTDYNEIKVQTNYTLGGMNYFSGNRSPRGYRISFTPCNHSNGMESSTLMSADQWESGFYLFIEPANRFNRRKLEALDAKLDHEKLAKVYATRNGQALKDAFTAMFQPVTINA